MWSSKSFQGVHSSAYATILILLIHCCSVDSMPNTTTSTASAEELKLKLSTNIVSIPIMPPGSAVSKSVAGVDNLMIIMGIIEWRHMYDADDDASRSRQRICSSSPLGNNHTHTGSIQFHSKPGDYDGGWRCIAPLMMTVYDNRLLKVLHVVSLLHTHLTHSPSHWLRPTMWENTWAQATVANRQYKLHWLNRLPVNAWIMYSSRFTMIRFVSSMYHFSICNCFS